MVQIDVAGPRLPATFEIKPDDIRQMAAEVLQECVSGPSKIGGFATSSLDIMDNWLTASMTSFQLPFRMSLIHERLLFHFLALLSLALH